MRSFNIIFRPRAHADKQTYTRFYVHELGNDEQNHARAIAVIRSEYPAATILAVKPQERTP